MGKTHAVHLICAFCQKNQRSAGFSMNSRWLGILIAMAGLLALTQADEAEPFLMPGVEKRGHWAHLGVEKRGHGSHLGVEKRVRWSQLTSTASLYDVEKRVRWSQLTSTASLYDV